MYEVNTEGERALVKDGRSDTEIVMLRREEVDPEKVSTEERVPLPVGRRDCVNRGVVVREREGETEDEEDFVSKGYTVIWEERVVFDV